MLGQRGEEVDHQHDDDEAVGQGGEHPQADAQGAAEDLLARSRRSGRSPGPCDDVELVVELLDLACWPAGRRASPGALRVISAICSLITGATATTNSVSTPITATSTSSTDSPRLMPRRMNELDDRVEPDRQEHRRCTSRIRSRGERAAARSGTPRRGARARRRSRCGTASGQHQRSGAGRGRDGGSRRPRRRPPGGGVVDLAGAPSRRLGRLLRRGSRADSARPRRASRRLAGDSRAFGAVASGRSPADGSDRWCRARSPGSEVRAAAEPVAPALRTRPRRSPRPRRAGHPAGR